MLLPVQPHRYYDKEQEMEAQGTPRNLVPMDERELELTERALRALRLHAAAISSSEAEELEDLEEKIRSWREEA